MIFIDEIDAVGAIRMKKGMNLGGAHRESEMTLNQLLSEMDGFESEGPNAESNILVISATNLLSNLDPALLRAGRFDHKIEVKMPGPVERAEILKIHLENKQHSLTKLEISKAATVMDNWSGAEIENGVNLAAIESVRTGHEKLSL